MDTTNNLLINGLPNQAELNSQFLAAADRSDIASISDLIAAGADVNITNSYGLTALMMAADRGDVATVTALLAAPNILVNQVNQTGETALILATICGHTATVTALLAAPNILVNHVNQASETALMRAAIYGDTAIVTALLASPNILVNQATMAGITALMLASVSGHTATVIALLSDPRILVNQLGQTGDTALILAAVGGHTATVIALLAAPNILVNQADTMLGITALMVAALRNSLECVEALIAKGADIHLKNNAQQTALTIASNAHHTDVAYRILSAMKDEELTTVQASPLRPLVRQFKTEILAIQTDIFHTLRAFHHTPAFASLEGPISSVFDFDSKPKWYRHRMALDISSAIEKLNKILKIKEVQAEHRQEATAVTPAVGVQEAEQRVLNITPVPALKKRGAEPVVFRDTKRVKCSKAETAPEQLTVAAEPARRNPKRSRGLTGSYKV